VFTKSVVYDNNIGQKHEVGYLVQTVPRSLVRGIAGLRGGGGRRRLASLLDAMLIDENVLLCVHAQQTSEALERDDAQPAWDRTTLVTMM